MEARANIKEIRISPQKVRLVCDLIRNKSCAQALLILKHCPKRSAGPLFKLLNSCISNAVNNKQMNGDLLYIKEIFVNEGRTLKRMRPRAKGRADQILKRTSKIYISVEEKGSSK